MILNLCHYDKSSMLAEKLHAVVGRSWVKGWDLYDLVWYLADRIWPKPNMDLLNAALEQTGRVGPHLTEGNWPRQIRHRVEALDCEKARADVRPFLDRERDLDLVRKEILVRLLE